MKLFYQYKTRSFWFFIILISLLFYAFCALFIDALKTENQKIRIECSRAQDKCIIKKSESPYRIEFKSSLLSKVEQYTHRSCHDIKFVFGDKNNYQRLYGAGSCIHGQRNFYFIINEFTNYIKNKDEYLLVKIDDNFHLSFADYFLFGFLLLLLFAFFMYPKKQEIYLNFQEQKIFIYKYNLFNKCYRKTIKLLDVKEFFVTEYSQRGVSSYHIKCKYKNNIKTDFLLFLHEKDEADSLCKKLNELLDE